MRTEQEQIAYQQGYDAYAQWDHKITGNPYMDESNLIIAWNTGWYMAQDDHREHQQSQSPLREEEMDGSYGEADH